MTELEQEKALHQLAVERANRACERADAAEAERDALREALARVEALVEYWKGRRDLRQVGRNIHVGSHPRRPPARDGRGGGGMSAGSTLW